MGSSRSKYGAPRNPLSFLSMVKVLLTRKSYDGRQNVRHPISRFWYFFDFQRKNEEKTQMSRFGKLVFVRARPLIFSSIDGKSSIFSDGTLLLSRKLSKSSEKVILLKTCLKYIDFFESDVLKVLTPEWRKKLIFNFWCSTYRRKIARGFRIWPYFFEFCT